MKKIVRFFDRIEKKLRGKLSHHPVLYALIGGIGVILFWRGVWHIADDINLGSSISFVIGIMILLVTGVFVSEFIGKKIIMSGLLGEQRIAEKEESEIETEETQLEHLQNTLDKVEKKLDHLEKEIEEK